MKPFILTAISVLAATSAAERVLGVSPEHQHLYVPSEDGLWSCLGNPEIKIRHDQINDDQCDCPDGSDEPGTNACADSNTLFYCENKGHFPGFIERFKLNDGVCDYDKCCDGSDEYLGGKCPNRCKEINKQFTDFSKKIQKEATSALQQRERLWKDAQNRRAKLELQIERLEALKKGAQDAPEAGNEKNKKQNEENVLKNVKETIDTSFKDYEAKIALLESILEKMMSNYNPNFNDAAVKEAIKDFQNYISNVEDSTGFPRDQLAKLLDTLKPESVVQEVQEEVGQVNDKVKEYQKDIEIFSEDLKKNYGKDDIYRAVKEVKISSNYGDYNYRIALLDSIHQDKVLVGKFTKFDDEDENILYYTNGAKCWNGPNRSAKIILSCGKSHDIISVSEPEKCEYTIEMTSPIACHELSDEDIINKFRVDYSQL